MAYFDTDKFAGEAATGFAKMQNALALFLRVAITGFQNPAKTPEDLIAAKMRAEVARRRVDTLLR